MGATEAKDVVPELVTQLLQNGRRKRVLAVPKSREPLRAQVLEAPVDDVGHDVREIVTCAAQVSRECTLQPAAVPNRQVGGIRGHRCVAGGFGALGLATQTPPPT